MSWTATATGPSPLTRATPAAPGPAKATTPATGGSTSQPAAASSPTTHSTTSPSGTPATANAVDQVESPDRLITSGPGSGSVAGSPAGTGTAVVGVVAVVEGGAVVVVDVGREPGNGTVVPSAVPVVSTAKVVDVLAAGAASAPPPASASHDARTAAATTTISSAAASAAAVRGGTARDRTAGYRRVMSYSLRCGDVVDGCPAQVTGESEEDVLRQAADHARDDHGLADLDEATVAKVRSAIRPA